MKALSIRQPWAWLITCGLKDIENRPWPTRFRGEFLVHAGMTFDFGGYEWLQNDMGIVLPRPDEMNRGGIVGRSAVVNCVQQHPSKWFQGPYGFVLDPKQAGVIADIRRCPGRLKFFDVDLGSLPERM